MERVLFFLILGIICIILAILDWVKICKIRKANHIAIGKIIDMGEGAPNWVALFKYVVKGKEYTGKMKRATKTKLEIKNALSYDPKHQAENALQIYYDVKRPKNFVVAGETRNRPVVLFILGLFSLVLGFLQML